MTEILALIFENFDRGAEPSTLVACALVNRSWEEPALRELWQEINNLNHLFQLLAPLDEEQRVSLSH
jgi:hypothetical protein